MNGGETNTKDVCFNSWGSNWRRTGGERLQIKTEQVGTLRGRDGNNRGRGRGSFQERGQFRGGATKVAHRCYNCNKPEFTGETHERICSQVSSMQFS